MPVARPEGGVSSVRAYVDRRLVLPVQDFIRTETTGGIVLLLAAIVAVLWANSPWSATYVQLWDYRIAVDLGFYTLSEDLRHWVNDGLMALFFFVVALEIKRELVHGQLSDVRDAALPVVAAVGGMLVPIAFFLAFAADTPEIGGWGIPMATDIAFALGVLALLGPRIPSQLRIFLLTLAIVDDLGAILVIALFYAETLSLAALAVAALVFLLVIALRLLEVRSVVAYAVVGIVFWAAIHESGVHATIAGVLLGLVTPATPDFKPAEFPEMTRSLAERFRTARDRGDHEAAVALLARMEDVTRRMESPLERLEHRIHPWTSYLIMPLFALANAGVQLSGDLLVSALSSPLGLGIASGLLVGKSLGVTAFSWLAVRVFGLATLPERLRWSHILGVGMLAGIGFTVSLFIAGLAFQDPATVATAKVSVIAVSLVAGVAGYTFLRLVSQRREPEPGG